MEAAYTDMHNTGFDLAPVVGRTRNLVGKKLQVILIERDEFGHHKLLLFLATFVITRLAVDMICSTPDSTDWSYMGRGLVSVRIIQLVRKTTSLKGVDIRTNLLISDILFENIKRCTSAGSDKIAWGP